MEARYNKNKYSANKYVNEDGKRHIVETTYYGEDFETLRAFLDFCKDNQLQVSYYPLGVAKTYNN